MVDHPAEEAVRQTMRGFSSKGERCHIQNVPVEAAKHLKATDPNRLDAPERIQAAIRDMVERGELTAPVGPWDTWCLNSGK